MAAKRIEAWLVALIAAHTFAVGAALLCFPAWALTFGGWEHVPPLFFPRQAGVFHFVLGLGYLYEYFRHGSVALLLTAKILAVVFLLGASVVAAMPWFVPFAGFADGAMGLAVLLARWQVNLEPSDRA